MSSGEVEETNWKWRLVPRFGCW